MGTRFGSKYSCKLQHGMKRKAGCTKPSYVIFKKCRHSTVNTWYSNNFHIKKMIGYYIFISPSSSSSKLCPIYIRVTYVILFRHFNLFSSKLSNSLHFFRLILSITINVFLFEVYWM